MRGSSGWGNNKLPQDFDENSDNGNLKAIVMLTNTYWEDGGGNHPAIDTDAYNAAVVGEAADGGSDARIVAQRRFESLCRSFRARNIKFYTLGIQAANSQNLGRWEFERVARGALKNICASEESMYTFINGESFAKQEDQLQQKLSAIAQDIKRKNSYVRLVD